MVDHIEQVDLLDEYSTYHSVNFGSERDDVPRLQVNVMQKSQHTEFHLGKNSADQALLVLQLLRQQARQRNVTLMLFVPMLPSNSDYGDNGFVKTSQGWCAVA